VGNSCRFAAFSGPSLSGDCVWSPIHRTQTQGTAMTGPTQKSRFLYAASPLLQVQRNGDSGSPRVTGSTRTPPGSSDTCLPLDYGGWRAGRNSRSMAPGRQSGREPQCQSLSNRFTLVERTSTSRSNTAFISRRFQAAGILVKKTPHNQGGHPKGYRLDHGRPKLASYRSITSKISYGVPNYAYPFF
jgi:hypothetical protein